jgi:hypothetical protein
MTKPSPALPTAAQTADILNGLLRGELSAVETYETALGRFADSPTAAAKLTEIRDEHAESVRILREHVERHGGTPATGSGVWGSFAAAATGAAAAVGPLTVLAALQHGEEVGIADYRRALDNGVPAECRDMILNDLLPRCEEHIAFLDDLQIVLA